MDDSRRSAVSAALATVSKAPTAFAAKAATGDYHDANNIHLSSDQRLKRVLEILKRPEYTTALQDAAAANGISPAAIAAAISWEFSQNKLGYVTDAYPLPQSGHGWGQVHMETMLAEDPSLTPQQIEATRRHLTDAIAWIGNFMKMRAERYRTSSSVDLKADPVALVWLYNTSPENIANSLKLRESEEQSKPADLRIQNDMAYWTSRNREQFSWLDSGPPIETGGRPYKLKSVAMDPGSMKRSLRQLSADLIMWWYGPPKTKMKTPEQKAPRKLRQQGEPETPPGLRLP